MADHRSKRFSQRRTCLQWPLGFGVTSVISPVAWGQAQRDEALDAAITQAYWYAFAVHDLARVRWWATAGGSVSGRLPVNTLGHARSLLTARDRGVTRPNNDTLYTSAWLDLSAGPVLLSLPAFGERYWSLACMDPFTDNEACLSRRTSGGGARTLWIASQRWAGEPPAGLEPLRLACDDVWMLARVLVDGPDDVATVRVLQDAMQLRAPLVRRPWATRPNEQDPQRFLAFVNEALGRNPVLARDAELQEKLKFVGLSPGESDSWARLDGPVQSAWRRLLPVLRQSLQMPNPAYRRLIGPGWMSGLDHIGRFGSDHAYRARIALGGLGALPREEAIYASAYIDDQGARLSGSASYRLRVPADLPVSGFWSLSMYEDMPDGRAFFVENPVQRYTVGDRTPGLHRDADGSVTIVLQAHAPTQPSERANWLPAPDGPFSLSWRLYEPGAALIGRHYSLPGVQRIA